MKMKQYRRAAVTRTLATLEKIKKINYRTAEPISGTVELLEEYQCMILYIS